MLRLTCFVFIFTGLAAADIQNGIVRSGGQAVPGAEVIAECGTDESRPLRMVTVASR